MDEYTTQKLYLKILQRLLDDVTLQWCDHNLLAPFLEYAETLMSTLEVAFGATEVDMRLQVKRVLLNLTPKVDVALGDWLQQTGLSCMRYLALVSNIGSPPDGLFICLLVQCLGTHVNLIHSNGIWSIHRSGILDIRDPAIVFMIDHFLAMPEVLDITDKLTQVKPGKAVDYRFCGPAEVIVNFVPHPPNLNWPVKNIADKCEEIDLVTFGEPVPFQELLADMAKMKRDEYCVLLMQWLQDHTSQLLSAHT